MNELTKIKDMIGKYGVSARTLRYYEDMGLMASVRNDDYPYRLYDEAAVKRLEQILILRRLNIGIKDIRRVFGTPGSDVVLEVLGSKVKDIDDEVALLHELKDVILEFIRQIKDADFSSDGDVKLLYEKARDIEAQLANVDYNGNPSNVNRLLEVTGKLERKPEVVRRYPQFSVCFGIYGDDDDTREAFLLYQKAFNAIKTWEALPYDLPPGNLHILMEINGFEFLLKTANGKNPGTAVFCQMQFDNEGDLRTAYEVLTLEGQGEGFGSAPHAPLSALVTDKYGFGWWLHT